MKKLPETPDIVLAKYRTGIFVSGYFWHGHKGCPKFVLPVTNTAGRICKGVIENRKSWYEEIEDRIRSSEQWRLEKKASINMCVLSGIR